MTNLKVSMLTFTVKDITHDQNGGGGRNFNDMRGDGRRRDGGHGRDNRDRGDWNDRGDRAERNERGGDRNDRGDYRYNNQN